MAETGGRAWSRLVGLYLAVGSSTAAGGVRPASCRGSRVVTADSWWPAEHGGEGVGDANALGGGYREQVGRQPGRGGGDRDSSDGRQAPGGRPGARCNP